MASILNIRLQTFEATNAETESEAQMRELWATAMGMSSEQINAGDDFFLRHSGDSFLAIKLAALARRQGLHISASDIINNSKLSQMAIKAVSK
ncbi:hypothetical protein BDV59DRAFT_185541 [Aspergillus ambiguus]|uniref:uncharacterized protein n=1 Tax=Aspergillus ambiguus TaxID=176160 RepID=UPI003CCCAED4